ncbi:acetate kinase [Sulfitobacter sp. D35]|uniref:acetate/propionate family kinase n=1 Tax=Sulfitobacter sp. D35 TaxID=3083252 RepID=UPI00296F1ADF|nr:acetate kinase [Sulfitobacter sp. D35]MDW4499024.1 acetate kinase [Sulfitobacter sp. D35]
MARGPILVLNAGSSSIKSALFDGALDEVLRLEATGIPGDGFVSSNRGERRAAKLRDHAAALSALLEMLDAEGVALKDLGAVAHRVVHGGTELVRARRVTPDVRETIEDCIPLAPLHNPHHLAAIDAMTALAPDLPQFASFDTAFHATNSDIARRYALPDGRETAGLQRYGFHGNSYAALVRALPQMTGEPLPRRLLALHLGNGASLCAILNGRSVATTMGYSPVSGITMGTRPGDIDANAVLHLARTLGIDDAHQLLNHHSGLLGLSGETADMRALTASDRPENAFAVEHFCYWAARHAGSMIAAMKGIDAIAFTGGIGENATEVRNNILDKLSWAGDIPSYTVPAAEERHIAAEAAALMDAQ